MAIPYEDSIKRTTAQPRFTDEVFATIVDRDAFLETLRYQGLSCFVIETKLNYQLVDGITNDDWKEDKGGSGSGVLPVADNTERDAIPEEDRKIGMIVYNVDLETHYYLKTGIENADWYVLSREIYSVEFGLTDGAQLTLTPRCFYMSIDIGAASGGCTLGNTPFGSVPPMEGAEITLCNISDNGYVVEVPGNASGTMRVIGPTKRIGYGDSVTYKYKSSFDGFVVKCSNTAF